MPTSLPVTQFLIAALIAGAAAGLCSADAQLDSFLQEQAERVVQQAVQDKIKVLGVLKLQTKNNGQAFDATAGPLGMQLAVQLEAHLIDVVRRTRAPIMIADFASHAATMISDADHRTPQGRKLLFLKGKSQLLYTIKTNGAAADAKTITNKPVDRFVTGNVLLTRDKKEMQVHLQQFDKDSERLQVVSGLSDYLPTLMITPDMYAGIGISHQKMAQVRGVFEPEERPASADVPIFNFSVYYDGKLVKPYRDELQVLRIPEPNEGQKVEFVISRYDNLPERLAVVLKVNGENTLYRQTRDGYHCAKWVLTQKKKSIRIGGYQIASSDPASGGERYEEFVVPSQEESLKFDYGFATGVISVEVFAEEQAPAPEPTPEAPSREEKTGTRMLAGIVNRIHDDRQANVFAGLVTRGLITSGQAKPRNLQKVEFRCQPDPVLVETIRYYDPKLTVTP